MEDEEQQQDTASTSFEDFLAAVGADVGGTTGFGADFQYSRRTVRGFSNKLTEAQRNAIAKQLRRIGSPGVSDAAYYYEGEFLVDQNGLVARAPYDPRQDTYNTLYGVKDAERATYLDLLATRGFYGSSKPSATGTLSKDRTAWGEMLTLANAEGLTWEAYLSKMASQPPVRSLGGGQRARVTPKEDIEAYLRQASLERLGRTMSRKDVDAAIAAIQQQEAAGTGPSLGTAAEQQVVQAEPERERAYRFARAIDLAMGELGS